MKISNPTKLACYRETHRKIVPLLVALVWCAAGPVRVTAQQPNGIKILPPGFVRQPSGIQVPPRVDSPKSDDPQIEYRNVTVAAPFGPQDGSGLIENGNLLLPIPLPALGVGYLTSQPPPSGAFDEGFGTNVKVFPSLVGVSAPSPTGGGGSSVAKTVTLWAANLKETRFLANGRSSLESFGDLRRVQSTVSGRPGYVITNADGSNEVYQQVTPQGIFLSSSTDALGNTTTVSYVGNTALPSRVTLPGGRGFILFESDGARVTKITGPLSTTISLSYTGKFLSGVLGPNGARIIGIDYDRVGIGVPTTITDENGDATLVSYKARFGTQGAAVVSGIALPSGRAYLFQHGANFGLITSPSGAVSTKYLVAKNPVTGAFYRREKIENGVRVAAISVDPSSGKVTSAVNRKGGVTKFSFAPSGAFDSKDFSSPFPTRVTAANGGSTFFKYEPSNAYRTTQIVQTSPAGISKETALSWKGGQLLSERVSVQGKVVREVSHVYEGQNLVPSASYRTVTQQWQLNDAGIAVQGINGAGDIWSLSQSPTSLIAEINGEKSSLTTAVNVDGDYTYTFASPDGQIVSRSSANGLARSSATRARAFGATPRSEPTPRTSARLDSLLMYSAFAQARNQPSGADYSCECQRVPDGNGGHTDTCTHNGPTGGCIEKTENRADGTETTTQQCKPPPTTTRDAVATRTPVATATAKPQPTPEESDGLWDPLLDLAWDLLGSIPDGIDHPDALLEGALEGLENEAIGAVNALEEMMNVARDTIGTLADSDDSYQSHSDLFRSVESGDVSVGDVALDLGLNAATLGGYGLAKGMGGAVYGVATGQMDMGGFSQAMGGVATGAALGVGGIKANQAVAPYVAAAAKAAGRRAGAALGRMRGRTGPGVGDTPPTAPSGAGGKTGNVPDEIPVACSEPIITDEKLKFPFGEAKDKPGKGTHNSDRSKDMANTLMNKLGWEDTPASRQLFRDLSTDSYYDRWQIEPKPGFSGDWFKSEFFVQAKGLPSGARVDAYWYENRLVTWNIKAGLHFNKGPDTRIQWRRLNPK